MSTHHHRYPEDPLAPDAAAAFERAGLADRIRQALRHGPLPDGSLHPTGDGDFVEIGLEFLRYFVGPGQLSAEAHVLEIGCGLGRMALPLAHYLDGGRYLGIEVSRACVDWCSRHLTPRFPHARFRLADIRHPIYNPTGAQVMGPGFRLPLPGASFDFVILISVFTHLPRPEMKRYLSEARRLLRPGGRLFATFFLTDPGDGASFASFDRRYRFRRDVKPHMHTSAEGPPLAAVAYDRPYVVDLLRRVKFGPGPQVHAGSWHSGQSTLGNYQDIIVAHVPE